LSQRTAKRHSTLPLLMLFLSPPFHAAAFDDA